MNQSNPATGLVAFVTGSTVSITEFLSAGSVFLTLIGSGVALAGGVWMYLAARNKAKISELELQRAELELQRAIDKSNDSHP